MRKINTPAKRAIKASGGIAALARKLTKSTPSKAEHLRMQSRISKWRIIGIPPRWVLAVEAASGVPRHELAPHIYPAPPRGKASAERERARA